MSSFPSESSRSAASQRPQIIYALIIREQQVVLVDYSTLQGNFKTVTLQILKEMQATSADWKSYIVNDCAIHYIVDQQIRGLWYVCMADRDMGRRIPFGLLQEMQESFLQQYTPEQAQLASENQMQERFSPALGHLMDKFNSPNADRLSSMRERVRDINENLMEGFERLMERHERIQVLVDRSHLLSSSSASFHREARNLRQHMWWKNVRMWIFLVIALLVAILFVSMWFCGITFNHC